MPEKIEQIPPERTFGVNAGKVWTAVHKEENLTAREIATKTKLTEPEVYGALGWLAKEGKVVVKYDGKRYTYKVF